MSNSETNQQISNEQQFQLWLDGKLSAEQSMQFEQSISDDDVLRQHLATARFIEQQVHCHEEHEVPSWDRSATFTSNKQPWWQWSGMPALSMAFSIFAICLVVFKVELVMQDNGLLVNFGGQSAKQLPGNVDALVNQRLKEFASEQQTVMAEYVKDIKDDQQDGNLKLATYLLTATRQERQEDMSGFIKYVNEQRDEDAIDQKLRFQKLEYTLQSQSIENRFAQPQMPLTKQNINFEQPAVQEK
ncbi:hypothetical protein [Thalassotalea sp. ND16A]|uniref:hypothetical protein n=1 Tax=Thalassotalea sp. ND16A TaxID=1535422 RepID=UPI00051A009F|nr:hypothetical protein [Thalassotalea sp. ND16A]KGJ92417.1 hypothetical protein ND16A_1595 [Thalassotalea sp. ND16A]